MKSFKRQSAFTLVELLIALSIFVIVMVTIVAAFRGGVFGYYAVDKTMVSQRKARQVLDRVYSDLRNSLVYSDKDTGFRGEADHMSFMSHVDTFEQGIWNRGVASIRYQWDDHSLARLCRWGKDALDEASVAQPEVVDIPEGSFAVQYGRWDPVKSELVFADAWKLQPQMPAAVKLVLTLDHVPFERIVAMPLIKGDG